MDILIAQKSGQSRAFPLRTALVSAAFALGAASLPLLLRSDSSGVMSISTYAVTDLWLCLHCWFLSKRCAL